MTAQAVRPTSTNPGWSHSQKEGAQWKQYPHIYTVETFPPTKAIVIDNNTRGVCHGGHCSGSAVKVAPEIPSPENWGWAGPLYWKPV